MGHVSQPRCRGIRYPIGTDKYMRDELLAPVKQLKQGFCESANEVESKIKTHTFCQ